MGYLAPACESTRHRAPSRAIGWALLVAVLLCAAPLRAEYASHPRIYLTRERIERIRTQHLAANSYEWRQLMKCAARSDMDGVQAQALAYAVTGDESWAARAADNLRRTMGESPELAVSFNSVGRTFHAFALAFDWLYHSPSFPSALKRQVIEYVNAVPEEGRGKWNWYPEQGYFNGAAKILWGPPVWGLATWGDNPMAQRYVDNGHDDRWIFVRNAFGYGPGHLAVAAGGCLPQGLDYGSGTLANLLRYVEAVRTATGEDLYEQAPALREYMEFFVSAYYDGGDFIRRPEHGHNAHKRGAYVASAVTALLIVMDRYSDTAQARRASWWLASVPGASKLPGSDHRFYSVCDVIFSDGSIEPEPPGDRPLAYFARGNGMWICRSDWSATGPRTFATFRAGNWTWFNQNQWDQGNFCITHLGEDLIVDGGLYDGGGGKTVINYHNQTIAHNSITVKDPAQSLGWNFFEWTKPGFENSGGQNCPWRETLPNAGIDGERKDPSLPGAQGTYLHDMADVLRRADNERYTYAFADLTNAYANARWESEYESERLEAVNYRPKVESVTRHWLYLRGESAGAPEHFAVFDRVRSTDPGFVKKSLLHFVGEPRIAGGTLRSADVAGHVETWAGSRFEAEQGRATLHGAILLPASPLLRKVGGKGYEYWVNGSNHDPYPDSEEPLGGNWRLEIQPPEPALDDLFFYILSPGARGDLAPAVAGISASGAEGAEFGSWVLLFSAQERSLGELCYRVESKETRRHLICDLEPGRSYRVFRDGALLVELLPGESGIGEFSCPGGGEFRLQPGLASPDS